MMIEGILVNLMLKVSSLVSINFQLTYHLPVKLIGLFFNKYFPLEANLYQL